MNQPVLHISVNGEARDAPPGATVATVLEALGLAGVLVAVEINEEIVPRAAHGTHQVEDGDAIEIVQFVGGG